MADLLLPVQLRDALGNYLASKPYAEVAQLIHAISNLRAADVPPPPSAD